MATNVGVGVSTSRNPEQATKEAVEKALKNAKIDKPDFVMLFATVGYDQPTVLQLVRKLTGNVPLSGCSGGGVITQGVGDESTHSLAVMVWKSDELSFKNYRATGLSKGGDAVGKEIAEQIGELPSDALALFVFADTLTFNFDAFNRGFLKHAKLSKLKQPLKMIGGAAGDAGVSAASQDERLPFKTFQYFDGEVVRDGIACAVLRGKGEFQVDFSHGCEPLGAARVVTKSEANVITEIDKKPALDVLGEYLTPEQAKNFNLSMTSMCLGLEAPKEVKDQAGDDHVIRVIAGKDDAKKAFMIYTETEPGTQIWMTRRNPDLMFAGVERLVKRVNERLHGKKPAAVFHVECIGRGMHMFREEDKMKILSILQQGIGKEVPWLGFYGYGEIAPAGKNNFVHNYTSVIGALTV